MNKARHTKIPKFFKLRSFFSSLRARTMSSGHGASFSPVADSNRTGEGASSFCATPDIAMAAPHVQFSDANNDPLQDHMLGTIYGNCAGDAIGLLTEFMTRDEARLHYGQLMHRLDYKHKVKDGHRVRWIVGDWTDDSDQMLLIMKSIRECYDQDKEMAQNYAAKLQHWMQHGLEELGDCGGCGIGATTFRVLTNRDFLTDPHGVAERIWAEVFHKEAAPNGGVMRTSALGLYKYKNVDEVIRNTLLFCKTTHADPRCQASCVAVTVAISRILLHYHHSNDHDKVIPEKKIEKIIQQSLERASECLRKTSAEYDIESEKVEGHILELERSLRVTALHELSLDEPHKIGYTFKTLGAGFWALKQNDFREAIQAITMEAGDADTNCAVAGALLGCKVGFKHLPKEWVEGLCYRKWLDNEIESFLQVVNLQDAKDASVDECYEEGQMHGIGGIKNAQSRSGDNKMENARKIPAATLAEVELDFNNGNENHTSTDARASHDGGALDDAAKTSRKGDDCAQRQKATGEKDNDRDQNMHEKADCENTKQTVINTTNASEEGTDLAGSAATEGTDSNTKSKMHDSNVSDNPSSEENVNEVPRGCGAVVVCRTTQL